MPPKSTHKKKKTYKKKSYKKNKVTLVNRGLPPIAQRYITKLKYQEANTLLYSAAGATIDYVMNLNSLFDPNRTGGGHQPMGFDQMALLYHRYRVFAASWRVNFHASGSLFSYMVLPANDVTSLSAEAQTTICEFPRTIRKLSKTTNPTSFTGHISLPDLNGTPHAVYKADDRFQAFTISDPNELMGLHIIAAADGGSSQTATFDVEITYHCEFFDPRALTAS